MKGFERVGQFYVSGDKERAEVYERRPEKVVLEVFDNKTSTDTGNVSAYDRALAWAKQQPK